MGPPDTYERHILLALVVRRSLAAEAGPAVLEHFTLPENNHPNKWMAAHASKHVPTNVFCRSPSRLNLPRAVRQRGWENQPLARPLRTLPAMVALPSSFMASLRFCPKLISPSHWKFAGLQWISWWTANDRKRLKNMQLQCGSSVAWLAKSRLSASTVAQ